MISNTRRALLLTVAPAAAALMVPAISFAQAVDNSDIVKAELERASAQAAAARASTLLRDPASPVIGNSRP